MNYKLAKQLKEAGFPQNIFLGSRYFDLENECSLSIINSVPMGDISVKDWLKVPTLLELIENCKTTIRLTIYDSTRVMEGIKGKGFGRRNWAKAEALGVFTGKDKNPVCAEAKDEDDAMAKLYIKLNKK